jgi:hypothetical protein
VAYAIDPSVTTSSTDISFENLVFWNLFEFSVAEITFKNQYHLPHSESKSHKINSIKSCSSRSFPTTPKAHSNFSEIFHLQFNLIFSEEIIQYSSTSPPQVQTP